MSSQQKIATGSSPNASGKFEGYYVVAGQAEDGSDDRRVPVEGEFDTPDEAVLNALVAAETMTGRNGRTVLAIDHERLRKLFAR